MSIGAAAGATGTAGVRGPKKSSLLMLPARRSRSRSSRWDVLRAELPSCGEPTIVSSPGRTEAELPARERDEYESELLRRCWWE